MKGDAYCRMMLEAPKTAGLCTVFSTKPSARKGSLGASVATRYRHWGINVKAVAPYAETPWIN